MTSLNRRVAIAFVAIAMIPIVLSLWLVWLASLNSTDHGLRVIIVQQIQERERQQERALARLCRDDLAVDRILLERSSGEFTGQPIDADRVFSGIMQSLGLDVLWVVEAGPGDTRGDIIARGHRSTLLQTGSTLLDDLEAAGGAGFLFALAPDRSQQFHVAGCTVARGGAAVAVLGGFRLQDVLSIAPDLIDVRIDDYEPALWRSWDARKEHSFAFMMRTDRGPILPYFLALALVSIVFALALAWWVSKQVSGSLVELTAAAERVGRGELDTTVNEGKHQEFKATATAFNRMTHELRAAQSQLRQAERVAAWRDIAKRLAHELKNPLLPIQMSIESLRKAHERERGDFDEVFDESTRTILQEVHRLRGIVDEFSRFAQLPRPKPSRFDVRSLVSDVLGLHAGTQVELALEQPEGPVEVEADREQLTQVLMNLVQNAIDAANASHPKQGGRVELRVGTTDGRVEIVVSDNGRGIPSGEEDAIFEPYFTTKDGGTGLGLAISQRIVTEHGGTLVAGPSAVGGAELTVRLPKN